MRIVRVPESVKKVVKKLSSRIVEEAEARQNVPLWSFWIRVSSNQQNRVWSFWNCIWIFWNRVSGIAFGVLGFVKFFQIGRFEMVNE